MQPLKSYRNQRLRRSLCGQEGSLCCLFLYSNYYNGAFGGQMQPLKLHKNQRVTEGVKPHRNQRVRSGITMHTARGVYWKKFSRVQDAVSIRSSAILKYVSCNSHPMKPLSFLTAAMPCDPAPINPSKTMSPFLEEARINSSISVTGFSVG